MMMKSIFIQLLGLCLCAPSAFAFEHSGKILLTGGVSQIEGAGGGGLSPWATIGGYGTEDEVGANAFSTTVQTQAYQLSVVGGLVGFFDRAEVSFAKQTFNAQAVSSALGLGYNYKFVQDVFGLKVKVLGDAVLDQDTWLPQLAVGIQYKENEQGDVVRSVGAKDDRGTDFYLVATKIVLEQSLLYSLTLRSTKANQIGILGYGGDKNNNAQLRFEGTLAYLLNQHWAAGIEYRQKNDNLKIAKEEDWADGFVSWAPTKNISLTVAAVSLGSIVLQNNQQGLYSSLQVGF